MTHYGLATLSFGPFFDFPNRGRTPSLLPRCSKTSALFQMASMAMAPAWGSGLVRWAKSRKYFMKVGLWSVGILRFALSIDQDNLAFGS